MTTTKPMLKLTAADLMSRDLITISRHLTLHAAAHRLVQAHVTGAPVIDEEGRCIGVLSATDLVRWLDRARPRPGHSMAHEDEYHSPWQMPDLANLPDDEVGGYMTSDVVTTPSTTCIGDLARHMLDAQIHRIIVLDSSGRPCGIVTSTDILAAVVEQAKGAPARVPVEEQGALV